jgi:hypothetical protein
MKFGLLRFNPRGVFLRSTSVHLDLKVTSDLVPMRGCGGDRPKLDGALVFLCTARRQKP